MSQLFFSSVLNDRYYNDLETLMFFNPQQGQFAAAVIQSVESYGSPKIVRERSQLRLSVGTLTTVQSLFGFDSNDPNANLIGVILYMRECIEQITILHIAIREEYAASGQYADQLLALHLIHKVRNIASQIKGVQSVALIYGESMLRSIPVHHAGKQPMLSR